jgi:excisionase family DNA binding protein
MAIVLETYLTTDEVAARIRSTRATVIGLINRGELPATRFGRSWRIKERDFEDYLIRNSNQGQGPAKTEGN